MIFDGHPIENHKSKICNSADSPLFSTENEIMRRPFCALAVGLLLAAGADRQVLADLPPHYRPSPPPDVGTAWRLVIVPTQDSAARLLLPHDFLARHHAEPMKMQDVTPGGPALPTILAGLALAIGMVLTGLMIRRRSPRLVLGSASCLLAGLLLVSSSCSPRPRPIEDENRHVRDFEVDINHRRAGGSSFRPSSPPTLDENGALSGEVLLEEGALGDSLRLLVNEETLAALIEAQDKKVEK
jgi:hypothetical protein